MPNDFTTLTRREIRKIFRRHRGSSARLAEQLSLNPCTVANWFRNPVYKSEKIETAATAYALELLAQEQQKETSHAA